MLETILAISGKPGLYRLISRGNRNLIVENLEAAGKRFPTFATDKIISLADIAMYTTDEEVPLRQVFNNIKAKQNGAKVDIDVKKASAAELVQFMGEVLPEFDRDRVYNGDIKKLISWYNILVEQGLTDFDEPSQSAEADNAAGSAE